jgi:TolB protein
LLSVFAISPHHLQGQTAGRIASFSDRDGATEIYVMEADGSNQRAVTQNTVEDRDPVVGDYTPVWAPDGKRLAFVSERNGGAPDIYVVDADGSTDRE